MAICICEHHFREHLNIFMSSQQKGHASDFIVVLQINKLISNQGDKQQEKEHKLSYFDRLFVKFAI